MKNYIAQGDCIIKKVGVLGIFNKEYSAIPKDIKPVKGNLILKGTTNSHALYGGKFSLMKSKDGTLFIKVTKATKLDHVENHLVKKPKHAEHHAIKLPVGEYFLDNLMEYDHQKEESRIVID